MHLLQDQSWERQGFTILWGDEVLRGLVAPNEVLTVRELFQISQAWPLDLPHLGGSSLIVAGLDGVLDSLAPDDAERWLAGDLRTILLSFQGEFEAQASLILWLPEGRLRIHMPRATEAYHWKCGAPFGSREIALGQLLWSGAQDDVARIVASGDGSSDPDGPAWIGLHLRRIS